MTYLSRIWLNPLRKDGQRLLRNRQAMHAAVLGGLSRQPVTERVLWRLETEHRHRFGVLVLTESRPSWEHLVEQAGWPGSDEPQAVVKPYQPLLDQVTRGRQFAFRLVANPVGTTKRPTAPSTTQRDRLAGTRPRGVRVPHRTARHQLEWLTSRIESWGFTPLPAGEDEPAVKLTARERLTFNKRDDGQGRRVVLETATFEGLVEITDPETAVGSLLDGVGPAKGYGLGLITLAPPQPIRVPA
nr:type I-E CRISPR-associated protein Cas6/Cse3/CasE [Micromonospora sp. DSM 115978]